ncbi:MAG: hypothetical protein IH899_14270, partial [Planctomycetes bacterium]|nr:hypothetical protein [Planctomycetota bacterium]
MQMKKARPLKTAGQRSSESVQPTDANSNPPTPALQDHQAKFLIGPGIFNSEQLAGCQFASTMHGWSVELASHVVIQIRCKRWTCPHCGQRKMTHFAHEVSRAKPNRLITLTIATRLYTHPREAYDKTRRALPKLTTQLRKAHGEFEYFRVLEATKKGWPHYHLVTRCPYISQSELSHRWNKLTGAPIVDVRQIKKAAHVYRYVMKYLGKQLSVPWTDRRVSWTRNFFVADDFEKGPGLEMPAPEWSEQSPAGPAPPRRLGYT